MTKLTITGTILVFAVATGLFEARQASRWQKAALTFQRQQAPSGEQAAAFDKERDQAARQLVLLREENERLNRDTPELLRLRSEVGRLRGNARKLTQGKAGDPTTQAAQAWLARVDLLKKRFEQWPGTKTPELQLLTQQDWLNEVASLDLDSDEVCREAIRRLRSTAKCRFASIVNEAIEKFASSNNEQLPSDISQLTAYLKPPMDSCLERYEVAKNPELLIPPQPGPENGERAKSWAIIEKKFPSADRNYDSRLTIYQGGFFLN